MKTVSFTLYFFHFSVTSGFNPVLTQNHFISSFIFPITSRLTKTISILSLRIVYLTLLSQQPVHGSVDCRPVDILKERRC